MCPTSAISSDFITNTIYFEEYTILYFKIKWELQQNSVEDELSTNIGLPVFLSQQIAVSLVCWFWYYRQLIGWQADAGASSRTSFTCSLPPLFASHQRSNTAEEATRVTDSDPYNYPGCWQVLSPTRKETSCACQKCDGQRNGLILLG